ncbi:MAG: AI-2E family transporter [Acidobacteria bacterium]|nr:AI-2E family transporter [Acidobacteriota bacterium]
MPATGSENAKFVVKVLIAVSIVVFVCLIGLLAYFTIDVILLVFAAILLSIFLRGLADLVNTGGRLSEGLSVFLVSTILLIVLAGAVSLLAPDIVDQYRNLRTELPKSWLKIDEYLNQFGWGRAILEQLPDSTEIKRRISEVDFANPLSQAGGYFHRRSGRSETFS